MARPRNHDPYKRIPLTEITKPVDGYIVKVNRWWLVDNGHALIWATTNSCQCNADKAIMEYMRRDRLLDIVFLPVAYVPLDHGYA